MLDPTYHAGVCLKMRQIQHIVKSQRDERVCLNEAGYGGKS